MGKKYSEDVWQQLTNADCVATALSLGLQFDEKRSDKSALRVADSGGLFVFRDGHNWYCHSTGEKGRAIDLVIRERSCNYSDALDYINENVMNGRFSTYEASDFKTYTKTAEHTDKPFALPEAEHNSRRAYAYLISARKIDAEIVKTAVTKKWVIQEKAHGNCCFIGYDKAGAARYCAARGTVTLEDIQPYKGEVEGSNKLFGFTMPGISRKLYVFEAAIDAMSHASLAKICGRDWLSDTRFAMGGCYPPALVQHLKDYPDKYDEIIVCTDNDEAGNGMLKRITEAIPDGYTVKRKTPITKDWNEDLQVIHKMASIGTSEKEPCIESNLSLSMHDFYYNNQKLEKEVQTEFSEQTSPELEP